MSHGSHSVVIGLRDLTNYETTGRSKITSASNLVVKTANVYLHQEKSGCGQFGQNSNFSKKSEVSFMTTHTRIGSLIIKLPWNSDHNKKAIRHVLRHPVFLWGMNTCINRRWIPDREKASGLEQQTELCQWLKNNWSTIFPLNIETANCQRQCENERAKICLSRLERLKD